MAYDMYFVDGNNGDDLHDGYDHLGFYIDSGDWTASTKVLIKTGGFATDYTGAAYTHQEGDIIHISSVNAGNKHGWYYVESKDSNNQLTLGDLVWGDGIDTDQIDVASSNGPFATFAQLMASVAKGDYCYVKTGTYTQNIAPSTVGDTDEPIIIEAYKSVPGDEGDGDRVIVDGEVDQRQYGFAGSVNGTYYKFNGFDFIRHYGDGCYYNLNCSFINCDGNNNTGRGFYGLGSSVNIGCSASGNGGHGFHVALLSFIYGTSSYNNGGDGIYCLGHCSIFKSIFYGNSTGNINIGQGGAPLAVIESVSDGIDNSTPATGINLTFANRLVIINNIVQRHTLGMTRTADYGNITILRNNCFYDNTADSSNFPNGFDNISSNPKFVDEDNGDYRLAANSPCIDAGFPTSIESVEDAEDIGTLERVQRSMPATVYDGTY